MLRASLEAVVALAGRRPFASAAFSLPAAPSTRCLKLKAHGVEPQVASNRK